MGVVGGRLSGEKPAVHVTNSPVATDEDRGRHGLDLEFRGDGAGRIVDDRHCSSVLLQKGVSLVSSVVYVHGDKDEGGLRKVPFEPLHVGKRLFAWAAP